MASKLAKLRALFDNAAVLKTVASLDGYLLPSTDAHQSEYLADYDFRVRFLSGFSGSNAFTLITREHALLWTDGRYFIQASRELEEGWSLMKQAVPEAVTPEEWILKNLTKGSKIGFDPAIYTFDQARNLMLHLHRFGYDVVPIATNLVDIFWADRPPLPNKKLIVLSEYETGDSVAGKLKRLREEVAAKSCSCIVLQSLDDIMWMLNVRGGDIPFNPLAYSYLLITQTEAHIFIHSAKLNEAIREHLSGIFIHEYEEVVPFLTAFRSESMDESEMMFLPVTTSYAIGNLFGEKVFQEVCPVQLMKSRKNEAELRGMRAAAMRDSIALIKFFNWLEKEVASGRSLTEGEAALAVDAMRTKEEHYIDLSFTTISAVGEHAALPHYHPSGDSAKSPLSTKTVYLCDSGAHYRDGTTDVTRTVWYGGANVPGEFRKHFTLVLMGHIDLALINFPSATNAFRLDVASRQEMWKYGLDFQHGVGHGVGHFLNVHEVPNITYRIYKQEGNIYEGMVITIEPGLYFDGKWGIRIENCYEIVNARTTEEGDKFLTFKSLTLVPIQKELIESSLLEAKHITWLNEYHARVWRELERVMRTRSDCTDELLDWLRKACEPLQKS